MFRFTIRDVLWLTVVAALGVGWWVERDRSHRVRHESGNWERTAKFLWRLDPDSKEYTLEYYDYGDDSWIGVTPKLGYPPVLKRPVRDD